MQKVKQINKKSEETSQRRKEWSDVFVRREIESCLSVSGGKSQAQRLALIHVPRGCQDVKAANHDSAFCIDLYFQGEDDIYTWLYFLF
jgi:hypothetical protein